MFFKNLMIRYIRAQNFAYSLRVCGFIFSCTFSNPSKAGSSTGCTNKESFIAIKISSNNIILFNCLWNFSKWSLNSIHATFFLNLSHSITMLLVRTIMTNETIGEEFKNGIIFVTLLNRYSCNFSWGENTVS